MFNGYCHHLMVTVHHSMNNGLWFLKIISDSHNLVVFADLFRLVIATSYYRKQVGKQTLRRDFDKKLSAKETGSCVKVFKTVLKMGPHLLWQTPQTGTESNWMEREE